jgi:hypothetical protein
LTPDKERGILWLIEQDPDEVVGALEITTAELLDAFPYHLARYLEDNFGEPDEDTDVGIP